MSKKNSFLVVRISDKRKEAMKEESDLLDLGLSQYTRGILDNRMDVIRKING